MRVRRGLWEGCWKTSPEEKKALKGGDRRSCHGSSVAERESSDELRRSYWRKNHRGRSRRQAGRAEWLGLPRIFGDRQWSTYSGHRDCVVGAWERVTAPLPQD